MTRFAVAVTGPDRPGIVSAVSDRLLQLGCNLEDVATSILRGHFSMMLVVAAPSVVGLADLQAALGGLAEQGLGASVWNFEGLVESATPTHVLTVYGRDSTGIVHAVSSNLAAEGVSICDMLCRLHEGEPPVYVITMEILVPPGTDPKAVQSRVAATCANLGLDSSLHEIERAEL